MKRRQGKQQYKDESRRHQSEVRFRRDIRENMVAHDHPPKTSSRKWRPPYVGLGYRIYDDTLTIFVQSGPGHSDKRQSTGA